MNLLALIQTDGGGLSEALASSPLLALATLFGAGVLTSLTPCVYPLVPITASVIAGTAREGQSKWRTVGLTLTYAVGLATLYAFLGALAGVTGTLFGTVSASPWARRRWSSETDSLSSALPATKPKFQPSPRRKSETTS